MFRRSHERTRPTVDEKPATSRKFRLRKPKSLDAVSICSHSSSSSAASTAMPRTPVSPHARHSRVVEFDPLRLHSTYHAPPPLAERPFIHVVDQDEAGCYQPRPRRAGPKVQDLDLAMDHERDDDADAEEEPLALRLDLGERPNLVRSHWSYSTINTLISDADNSDSEEEYEDDDQEEDIDLPVMHPATPDHITPTASPALDSSSTYASHFDFDEDTETEPSDDENDRPVLSQRSFQNFSYKRNTVAVVVPRRRPQEAMNSIDHYVKRGGWKRRGIVFQTEDSSECAIERLSARTVG